MTYEVKITTVDKNLTYVVKAENVLEAEEKALKKDYHAAGRYHEHDNSWPEVGGKGQDLHRTRHVNANRNDDKPTERSQDGGAATDPYFSFSGNHRYAASDNLRSSKFKSRSNRNSSMATQRAAAWALRSLIRSSHEICFPMGAKA